jgi:hypothetical protein
MKTSFFARLSILITFIGLIFSGWVKSQVVVKGYTAPVFVVIDNNGSINPDNTLKFSVQFDKLSDANYSIEEITNSNGNIKATLSSGRSKDGKIDVDIIIYKGALKPFVRPFSQERYVKLQLFTLQYITVDNISGVYQGNSSPGEARIDNIQVVDSGSSDASGGGSILEAQLSVPDLSFVSNTTNKQIAPERKLSLFPNPVREGNLTISFGDEFANVSSVQVYNSLGSLVSQFRPETSSLSTMQIPTGNLSNGVYFVRIKTSTDELVRKFNVAR